MTEKIDVERSLLKNGPDKNPAGDATFKCLTGNEWLCVSATLTLVVFGVYGVYTFGRYDSTLELLPGPLAMPDNCKGGDRGFKSNGQPSFGVEFMESGIQCTFPNDQNNLSLDGLNCSGRLIQPEGRQSCFFQVIDGCKKSLRINGTCYQKGPSPMGPLVTNS